MTVLQKCGTRSGAMAHYRRGEKPCDACRLAHNIHNLEQRRGRELTSEELARTLARPPMAGGPARCGTHSGAMAHYRRGEKPCDACRLAHNADIRAHYRRTHPDTYQVAAECGTRGGYERHHRRAEPLCDACRLAHNAYHRERNRLHGGTRSRKRRELVMLLAWRDDYLGCSYCRKPLTIETATIDHIQAQSRHGSHELDNLTSGLLAVQPIEERTKLLDEWLATRAAA